jgi:bifunctional enzyme CysN/CysC/sulfate adenylyltransferase subunit 1
MATTGAHLDSLSEIGHLFPASSEVLRFTTAGSVDDGKSTLIGRLLYDSQGVYEDQLASVRNSRINRSTGPLDFSLLTDGLRAEREQGITIDVAYRYFSTPRRKFIIADTPGHEQYTRNMATGASTADAAVVLIDATKGVLSQSRRHAYIASLLGIRHVVAAVNKMDIVGYSQQVFDRIAADFMVLANKLGLRDAYVIPISALEGDNVVRGSERMPWFAGPALLRYLEELRVHDAEAHSPGRFPVQCVIRPDASFRGFAGQVTSGTFSRGESVVALPSGVKSRIKSLVSFDGELEEAGPGSSVTVALEDEVDVSRGDLLAPESAVPSMSRRFRASMVWMHPSELSCGKLYLLKHTTRTVRAHITRVHHRVDIDSLEKLEANALRMNDIGSVDVETTLPLYFDSYRHIRSTGSFILIDQLSNATVAAGMIEGAIDDGQTPHPNAPVTAEQRAARVGHESGVVWIEDSPSVAAMVERRLFDEGWFVQQIDIREFDPGAVPAVVQALRRSGLLVIVSADRSDLKPKLVEDAGALRFFEIASTFGTDAEQADEVIERLARWREQSGNRNLPV